MYGYEDDPAWVRVGDHDNSDPGDTDFHDIQTFKAGQTERDVKSIVIFAGEEDHSSQEV